MNSKECKICKEATKRKYRFFHLWKALAIIFMCLTVLFMTLYFVDGDFFKETTEVNNTEVQVENNGDSNNNNIIVNN